MDKIKILIVEDDMIIAADISMHLTRMGYEVSAILPRGEDVLGHLATNQPDIVLMDIALKGTMDGVETALQIRHNHPTPVIFLTANADDATFSRAKIAKPYAFISKPFKRLDLIRAIELVINRLEEEQQESSASTTPDNESTFLLEDRIFVRDRDRMVKIYIKDILYVEAERNYCQISTAGKSYLMSIPLKTFEEKLSSEVFCRVHRSYIVNLTKIDSLGDNYEYLSIGKHKIPVSRSHKEKLLIRLKLI